MGGGKSGEWASRKKRKKKREKKTENTKCVAGFGRRTREEIKVEYDSPEIPDRGEVKKEEMG